MKVYFNAFWSGFFEKTNSTHVGFFLDLCTKIWNTECEIGSLEDSDILVETIFGDSVLKTKSWKYSILFSGESRIYSNTDEYTIVLFGQRNHKNIVNCPLFVPYLYCNNYTETLKTCPPNNHVARNEVLAVISNPNGAERNEFLSTLEYYGIPVTYAGHYKNNIGGNLQIEYKSKEFIEYVSQFKFIVTMENSIEDTYITEKICHGFLANTVPIYWGSKRVTDYFNKDRFLNLTSTSKEDMFLLIATISQTFLNEDMYNEIRNRPVYTDNDNWRTIDTIARDCRALLEKPNPFSNINQIHFVCNKNFEPERFDYLNTLIEKIGIDKNKVKFLSSTYKHTITSDIFDKHVRTPLCYLMHGIRRNLRKSELSLILNYLENLKDIEKNYLDGMFCIFESDIDLLPNYASIDDLFSKLKPKTKEWDLVHFASIGDDVNQRWKKGYIEDISSPSDSVRLERRFNTRCTDSHVFSMQGICKSLEWFITMDDYCLPMDYYFINLFNMNSNFKYYWSDPAYFYQRSNLKQVESMIQTDLE